MASGGIGTPATGQSQKAKDLAGIKARSIRKYGAGKMQRQANLLATYNRTHPVKAPKPKATTPANRVAGKRPPVTTQPNQRPGTTVIPLRKPGAGYGKPPTGGYGGKPLPKPLPKPVGTARPAGQRPPPDPTAPPRGNPGPGAKPTVIPLRKPGAGYGTPPGGGYGGSSGKLQGNGAGPARPAPNPFAKLQGNGAGPVKSKPIVGKVK